MLEEKAWVEAVTRAKEQEEAGDFQGAVRLWTEAIAIKPRNGTSYASRSWAYFNLRAFKEAFEDATEGIRLDPTLGKAFYVQALCYALSGDLDLGLKGVEEAIRKDAHDVHGPALCLRGSIHLLKLRRVVPAASSGLGGGGQREKERMALGTKAVADFTQAIRLNPRSAEAYYNRALLHTEFSRPMDLSRAIEDFTQALIIDSKIETRHTIVRRDDKSRLAWAGGEAKASAKSTSTHPRSFPLPGDLAETR